MLSIEQEIDQRPVATQRVSPVLEAQLNQVSILALGVFYVRLVLTQIEFLVKTIDKERQILLRVLLFVP